MAAGLLKRHKLPILLSVYAIAIAVFYSFPLESEWYSFYSYLSEHHSVPYIDTREGYPPLGFLIYMPIYYLSQGNSSAFFYGFKALNGIFLVSTLYVLYLILRKFDAKRSFVLTVCYAILPSVVAANSYSNDIVALLPAALGIYAMTKQKPLLCGILLGLATLAKGFPLLLLVPALIAFKESRDKLIVVGATFLTLLLASMPFLLLSPLTYISTFLSVGSRGPWETVWALIEGYRSHGGVLHPYFDKYFYHFNFLKIYSASSFDNAIYKWGYANLPDLLSLASVAVITMLSLAFVGKRDKVLPLCGLLYVTNMLFFKGYSTQFAVSTQFYTLLAAAYAPIPFLAISEASQMMQILAWNSRGLFPEFLSNEHQLLLVSSIIIRTIFFSALVCTALLKTRPSLSSIRILLVRSLDHLKPLAKRKMVLSVSLMMMFGLNSALSLRSYLTSTTGFTTMTGSVKVTTSDWSNIKLDGLQTGDKVVVKLHSNAAFDAQVVYDNSSAKPESGIRNPYNLKDSFNETLLFFLSGSEASVDLKLRLKHPVLPFRITDGLYGDLAFGAESQGSSLLFRLTDLGTDGKPTSLRMAYPIQTNVNKDFALSLRYTVLNGSAPGSILDVFDDTDEWIYSFRASGDFVLSSESKDLYGHSYLLGDHLSLVGLTYTLADNSSAVVRLDSIGLAAESLALYARDNEVTSYEVFIQRDFKPSIGYLVSLTTSAILAAVSIFLAVNTFKNGTKSSRGLYSWILQMWRK